MRDRATDSHIATFEPATAFAGLVKAEGIRRGADHVRQFTILGDGAPWIWTSPPRSSPRPPRSWTCSTPASTCTTSPAAWNSCSATTRTTGSPPAWKTSTTATSTASSGRRPRLPPDGIKKDELGTALGYFENNAPRMRYHWFRQCGLFVGSGVVEASCKSVIGQRLKRPACTGPSRCRRHRHPPLPAGQPPEDQTGPTRATRHGRLTSPGQARTTPPAGYRSVTVEIGVHPPCGGCASRM